MNVLKLVNRSNDAVDNEGKEMACSDSSCGYKKKQTKKMQDKASSPGCLSNQTGKVP